MFLSCNLLTVFESAPAKPDSPKFSYVEFALELLKVAINKVFSIDRSHKIKADGEFIFQQLYYKKIIL